MFQLRRPASEKQQGKPLTDVAVGWLSILLTSDLKISQTHDTHEIFFYCRRGLSYMIYLLV